MQKNKASDRAICRETVFSIQQNRGPSFLLNKYKLGRIQAGVLILNPFECVYLFLKGKIVPENNHFNSLDRLLEKLGIVDQLLDVFIVYNILKSRGFYVKMEENSLYYRRSPRVEYKGPVRVIRESGTIEFSEMIDNGSCIYAALDEDNDVTIFISELWDEVGTNSTEFETTPQVNSLGSSYTVESSEVPEWFGTTLGELKFLNRLEAGYISGKDELNDDVQAIFNDLIGRSFIVKTGFKYGANFRIYSRTVEEHADFLVHLLESKEQWYKISRAVRVAQGVRKEMVFSGMYNEKPAYVKLKRVRDPFSSEN